MAEEEDESKDASPKEDVPLDRPSADDGLDSKNITFRPVNYERRASHLNTLMRKSQRTLIRYDSSAADTPRHGDDDKADVEETLQEDVDEDDEDYVKHLKGIRKRFSSSYIPA